MRGLQIRAELRSFSVRICPKNRRVRAFVLLPERDLFLEFNV